MQMLCLAIIGVPIHETNTESRDTTVSARGLGKDVWTPDRLWTDKDVWTPHAQWTVAFGEPCEYDFDCAGARCKHDDDSHECPSNNEKHGNGARCVELWGGVVGQFCTQYCTKGREGSGTEKANWPDQFRSLPPEHRQSPECGNGTWHRENSMTRAMLKNMKANNLRGWDQSTMWYGCRKNACIPYPGGAPQAHPIFYHGGSTKEASD